MSIGRIKRSKERVFKKGLVGPHSKTLGQQTSHRFTK